MKKLKQEFQAFDEKDKIIIVFVLGAIFGAVYLFTLNSLFL